MSTKSIPSTSSQDNVESNLDILSTIQGATKLMVQIYHELFTLSKNDFIKTLHDLGSIHELFTLSKNDFMKTLHDLGSIHELRYLRDMIFATVRRRHNLLKAGHLINRYNSDNFQVEGEAD